MPRAADLAAAADAGVISKDQADRLAGYLSEQTAPTDGDPGDEESLRFIRSFHDVFIAVGVLLVWIGLSIVVGQIAASPFQIDGGEFPEVNRAAFLISAGANAAAALLFWIGAEFFAGRQRRLLPSIMIFLGFFSFALSVVGSLYVWAFFNGAGEISVESGVFDELSIWIRLFPIVLAGAAVAISAGFYARFRLPFSMGWLGASASLVLAALLFAVAPQVVADGFFVLLLACGILMLAAGVWWDARDPERRTRASDNGFWLHFFAAPVILTGALWWSRLGPGFTSAENTDLTFGGAQSIVTLVILGAFAVISLLINRRALIVAGLISAGVAIGALINASGLDGAWVAASTLLALGGTVVLLGAGWRGVRRVLTAPFPKTGAMARVIPPVTVGEG